MELVLASTSTYRKSLLARLRLPFASVAPGVDESRFHRSAADPLHLATSLARAKAEAVAETHPEAFVLGSDQVAEVDRQVLEKPGSRERAIEQLGLLSGRTHRLHTAFTLLGPGFAATDVVTVHLRMRALDRDAIERYVDADSPLDCCGSYKIESLGIALFDAIDAEDATAIEGLPLLRVSARLREAGFRLP